MLALTAIRSFEAAIARRALDHAAVLQLGHACFDLVEQVPCA
jgi:hypothetical protein